MSIPNEALQKLLQEIEQKSVQSQQQIAIVKAQIAGKNREKRMVQLTATELDSLPASTKVYEGVGRMFVQSPSADVKTKLGERSEELKSDTSSLEKKLHYLDTTAKNSQAHIDQLLKSGGKATESGEQDYSSIGVPVTVDERRTNQMTLGLGNDADFEHLRLLVLH